MTHIGQALPSQSSAADLVKGRLDALPMVTFCLLGRAFIIGAGITLLTRQTDKRDIARQAFAGSLFVELFVLAHELLNRGVSA